MPETSEEVGKSQVLAGNCTFLEPQKNIAEKPLPGGLLRPSGSNEIARGTAEADRRIEELQ